MSATALKRGLYKGSIIVVIKGDTRSFRLKEFRL